MNTTRWLRVMALACCLANAGCSNIGNVKPWEKGILAKPEMAFSLDPLGERFSEHIYSSREGASGGDDVASGGCGCN